MLCPIADYILFSTYRKQEYIVFTLSEQQYLGHVVGICRGSVD